MRDNDKLITIMIQYLKSSNEFVAEEIIQANYIKQSFG